MNAYSRALRVARPAARKASSVRPLIDKVENQARYWKCFAIVGEAETPREDWRCRLCYRRKPFYSDQTGWVSRFDQRVRYRRLRHGMWVAREARFTSFRPGKNEGKQLTIKTTRTIVSFNEPFSLRNVEGIQPAGSYAVCFEDELIDGLSHAAYRRISTAIQIPSTSSPHVQSRFVPIEQTDLDATRMKDLHQTI